MGVNYYQYKLSSFIKIKSLSSISYQVLNKDYTFNGESHSAWEFLYVDRNTVNVTICDNLYTLKNKEIIFVPPNLWHCVHCNGIDDANVFVVSFNTDDKLIDFFANKVFLVKNELIEILENLINIAYETFLTGDDQIYETKLLKQEDYFEGNEQLLKNYLEIFLILLYKQKINKSIIFSNKEEILHNTIENEILQVLYDNLYNKITLKDICGQTHYGKSFLCKKFKDKYNMTIMSYFMKLRIEAAKKQLKFTDISLKTISDELQFSSQSHFINTFKKFEGVSPAKFRKLIKPKVVQPKGISMN